MKLTITHPTCQNPHGTKKHLKELEQRRNKPRRSVDVIVQNIMDESLTLEGAVKIMELWEELVCTDHEEQKNRWPQIAPKVTRALPIFQLRADIRKLENRLNKKIEQLEELEETS
jgi:hypothetical protein